MMSADKRPVDYENIEYEFLDTQKMIQELMNRFAIAAFVGVQTSRVIGEQKSYPVFFHTEPVSFGLIGAVNTLESLVRVKALGNMRPTTNDEDNT